MNKKAFLLQKLNNFIKFIESKIGKDNELYKKFAAYRSNFDSFLVAVNSIKSRAIDGKLPEKDIKSYLKYQGCDTDIEKKDVEKINKYFTCFIKVLEY